MAKTVFDVLEEKLAAAQRTCEESLTEGAAKSFDAVNDYAAYRELCGVIRGLATARREVADLARHYRDTDDD